MASLGLGLLAFACGGVLAPAGEEQHTRQGA